MKFSNELTKRNYKLPQGFITVDLLGFGAKA